MTSQPDHAPNRPGAAPATSARGGTDRHYSGSSRWSPDQPVPASKRSLIAVSHAIEQALLDGPLTAPTVVVALFQRHAYLDPQYDLYARLAEAGAVVIVAFADGEAHDVPPGCHGIVLEPDEPLADEWSVIAVGPSAGAFLVATDSHRFDPTERTLEAGREFLGRWGYARVQAGNELARMRAALGSRLDPAVGTTIDRLLAHVMPAGGARAGSHGTDGEAWATISLHRMVQRMQDARAGTRILRAQLIDAHTVVSARAAAHTEPQSGLATPDFLARWTGAGGATALPIGVAVFDVAALDDASRRYDARAVYHAARRVATALTEPLGPVDAAVRVSERAFAVVVPGASYRHLRRLVAAVGEQLELGSDGYPGIPLRAAVASTVTLHRPLPLDDLHLALGTPDQPATTVAGDAITVTTTADSVAAARPGAVSDVDPPESAAATDTDSYPRIRVASMPSTADGADSADLASGGFDDGRERDLARRADRAQTVLSGLPRRGTRSAGANGRIPRSGPSHERPVAERPAIDGAVEGPAYRNGHAGAHALREAFEAAAFESGQFEDGGFGPGGSIGRSS